MGPATASNDLQQCAATKLAFPPHLRLKQPGMIPKPIYHLLLQDYRVRYSVRQVSYCDEEWACPGKRSESDSFSCLLGILYYHLAAIGNHWQTGGFSSKPEAFTGQSEGLMTQGLG